MISTTFFEGAKKQFISGSLLTATKCKDMVLVGTADRTHGKGTVFAAEKMIVIGGQGRAGRFGNRPTGLIFFGSSTMASTANPGIACFFSFNFVPSADPWSVFDADHSLHLWLVDLLKK